MPLSLWSQCLKGFSQILGNIYSQKGLHIRFLTTYHSRARRGLYTCVEIREIYLVRWWKWWGHCSLDHGIAGEFIMKSFRPDKAWISPDGPPDYCSWWSNLRRKKRWKQYYKILGWMGGGQHQFSWRPMEVCWTSKARFLQSNFHLGEKRAPISKHRRGLRPNL